MADAKHTVQKYSHHKFAKNLDHQSAPIDIYKAKSPIQVYQKTAALGAPEHHLTPICAPGVFARTFQKTDYATTPIQSASKLPSQPTVAPILSAQYQR